MSSPAALRALSRKVKNGILFISVNDEATQRKLPILDQIPVQLREFGKKILQSLSMRLERMALNESESNKSVLSTKLFNYIFHEMSKFNVGGICCNIQESQYSFSRYAFSFNNLPENI